jgi:mitochondrial chaperone BCS1
MDFITHLMQTLSEWGKTNPVVAGLIGAWSLSVVTLLCRNVPMKSWQFLVRQSTTSLTFTNEMMGRGMESFADFIDWFEKNALLQFSRSIAIYPTWGPVGIAIGLGEGRHYFRYNGKLFWLKMERLQNATNNQVIREVSITCFGRNRQLIRNLIEEFIKKPNADLVSVWTWREGVWSFISEVRPRPLKTVAIPAQTRRLILADIMKFQADREWYDVRGIAYKLTFILHGISGSGKSSFIKALASHFKMDLCIINISQMGDDSFLKALSTTPERSIILIEDIDSATATKKRGSATLSIDKSSDSSTLLDDLKSLTLTGILNALGGVLGLDNKIIFMTTNRYHELDEAVVRKGRVDHTYEFGKLEWREIQQYMDAMYPGNTIRVPPNLLPIVGCDLESLHMEHRDDVHAFCKALPIDPDWKRPPPPGFIAEEIAKLHPAHQQALQQT